MYSTASLKLFIVAFFFISVTVCTLVYQIFTAKITPNIYFSIFIDYAACEASGTDINRNCNQFLDLSEITPIFSLNLASVSLQTIIPLVILILNTNWTLFTNKAKKLWASAKSRRTSFTSGV